MKDSARKTHSYAYSYSVIEEDLKRQIKDGILVSDTQIPSENELSRKYGVSRMSARQALTNLVGEKLLYRIAGKGTFVCAPAKKAENTIIGLVLNNLGNPFFAQLTKTVQRNALAAGYDVIYYANNDLIEESKAIDTLLKRRVAGVVIVPSQDLGEERLVEGIRAAGIPLVYLNRTLKSPEADHVVTDNAQGAALAMEHLHSLGHRRIGFVAASPYTSAVAGRLESYNSFIRSHGLSDCAATQISSRLNEDGGYEGGRILLSSANRPTAIFCGNDITAVGVMKAARELGIDIPGDLSVVGYDDIELSAHLTPSLTTVAQPVGEMAEAAMAMLLERIRGAKDKFKQVALPSKLMDRGSCKRQGA